VLKVKLKKKVTSHGVYANSVYFVKYYTTKYLLYMILYPYVYIKMNTLCTQPAQRVYNNIVLYIMTQQISLPIFISPLKQNIYLFL